MNAVVVQVLILWAVLAAALGTLWLLKLCGVGLAQLRNAGVFGFIGAALGIVIGLTTFFASQHYASVRTAEQQEATKLATLVAMSGSFPARSGLFVRREIYCYVTDIIDREWPAMQRGDERGSPQVDGRLQALYQELLRVGRMNPQPSTWYSNAVTAGIEAGQDRGTRLLLGARGQIPNALWGLIYFWSGAHGRLCRLLPRGKPPSADLDDRGGRRHAHRAYRSTRGSGPPQPATVRRWPQRDARPTGAARGRPGTPRNQPTRVLPHRADRARAVTVEPRRRRFRRGGDGYT